jgi:hypothetical protein
MVIETKTEYNDLIKRIKDKDVAIVIARDDYRNHPAESKPILLSLSVDNVMYDVIYSHSESFSENLDIQDLSVVKRFWVDDLKEFYHLTKFENSYDIKLNYYLEHKQYEEVPMPQVFSHIYENNYLLRTANQIIPLVKVLEFTRDRLESIVKKAKDIVIKKYYLKYNQALLTFAKLEEPGMRIKDGSFDTIFRNGYGYPNFNIYTATGRPSNTFRGINFGAMNKKDGTRSSIISRFDKGMLVEFDYDAYHLRLLANILKFKVPKDESLHQYFADNVYKTSYEDSKKISWQILYGNISVSEEENPFFFKVDQLANILYKYFSKNKHFKSYIYKKPFTSDSITDVNKNKLLNYFIQSYETEQNIETISKLQKYLEVKETKMILYTYDSFLFDLDRTEGLKTVLEIKKILQGGLFPVKTKAGLNYNSMKDISERLNGLKKSYK